MTVRSHKASGGQASGLANLPSNYTLHAQPLEASELPFSTGHARGPGVAPGNRDPKSHPPQVPRPHSMVPLHPHANLDSEANTSWQAEAGPAQGGGIPRLLHSQQGSRQRGGVWGWHGIAGRGGHSSFCWLHIVNGGPCSVWARSPGGAADGRGLSQTLGSQVSPSDTANLSHCSLSHAPLFSPLCTPICTPSFVSAYPGIGTTSP